LHQNIFLDILRELQAAGTTILLSAHQMQLVERVADRVLVLSQGRELLSGTIASIKAKARASSRIFLRLADRPEVSSLTDYPGVAGVEWHPSGELAVDLGTAQSLSAFLSMVASRHEITSIRSVEPSLHEIFVSELSGLETRSETLGRGGE
jgi:ABC-2 type transport system ATP-binding protein